MYVNNLSTPLKVSAFCTLLILQHNTTQWVGQMMTAFFLFWLHVSRSHCYLEIIAHPLPTPYFLPMAKDGASYWREERKLWPTFTAALHAFSKCPVGELCKLDKFWKLTFDKRKVLQHSKQHDTKANFGLTAQLYVFGGALNTFWDPPSAVSPFIPLFLHSILSPWMPTLCCSLNIN